MRLYDEDKLAAVLEYIREHQASEGESPTYREIMRRCGFSNTGTVFRYIETLKRRGLLAKDERGGVAIDAGLARGRTVTVPLVGAVACGSPITAIENIEGCFVFPEALFGAGPRYMLRAKGSSMIEKGIYDGDILLVKRQDTALPGQVVIAMVGDEATAKIYLREKGVIILRAANGSVDKDGVRSYPDIAAAECRILGVVDNVIHRL